MHGQIGAAHSKIDSWLSQGLARLSHQDNIVPTEWETQKFQAAGSGLIPFKLGMYAFFRHKILLPNFISLIPEPRACTIDFLSPFCPTAVTPQLVQKMWTYPCLMTVVAPGWPGMALFLGSVGSFNQATLQTALWNNLLERPHNNLFYSNLAYHNLHA